MLRTKHLAKHRSMSERVRQFIEEKHKELMANVEQKVGEPEQRGFWFNKAHEMDQSITICTLHGKHIIKKLFVKITNHQNVYNVEEKLWQLNVLCANLLISRRNNPVKVSLNTNYYKKNRYNKLSSYFISLINNMNAAGMINVQKGFHAPQKLELSRQTRIWPTKMMLDLFHPFDLAEELEVVPVEIVNLRDKNRKLIPYKDTVETKYIRSILSECNLLNRKSNIQIRTVCGFIKVQTDLHAVFNNGSFAQGGRLYTGACGYQFYPKKERATIYINKKPTVELDFSGLHPRLLYALVGHQYDHDPYEAVSEDRALRPLLKTLLFMLLYAENEQKAVAAGNYEFCYKKYHHIQILLRKAGIKVADLIEMYKRAHRPIEKYFNAQACFMLMNLDSKIALSVIEHFVTRGIPILSIHDSFIVERSHERELRITMQSAYKKHSGGFDCPIG